MVIDLAVYKRVITNGRGTFNKNVTGKLLKYIVLLEKDLPNVNIKFFSRYNELLIEVQGLKKGFNIFFDDVDNFGDNNINFGQLSFEVSGLNEGDNINEIHVLYES